MFNNLLFNFDQKKNFDTKKKTYHLTSFKKTVLQRPRILRSKIELTIVISILTHQ